jgi:hypothetical protein
MQRYLLFAGDNYYPLGGWNDFVQSFGDESEAIDFAVCTDQWDWWEVIDSETGMRCK